MKYRWLLNLVLLLIVILLAMRIQGELEETRTPAALTDRAALDLLEIEISREGEPTIRLSQSAQGWRMEAPMQVDAETEQVDKLLGVLSTPVHRTLPKEGAAVDELGLTSSSPRLRLDTRMLTFGGTDPVAHYRYVAEDTLVHLIDDRFYHLVIAPPIAYVSRHLLPRGFSPVFGQAGDVPLAADALSGLEASVAERLEALPADWAGTPIDVEGSDGSRLSFQVSEDRRRWGLTKQRLLYVLTRPPDLPEDPTAVDPTPNIQEPAATESPNQLTQEPGMVTEILDGSAPGEADPVSVDAPAEGQDVILPGDDLPASPPEIKLTPDDDAPERRLPSGPLRGEPDKAAPFGFGQDPFAPDPPPEPPTGKPR